jgi:hypothetical protein
MWTGLKGWAGGSFSREKLSSEVAGYEDEDDNNGGLIDLAAPLNGTRMSTT